MTALTLYRPSTSGTTGRSSRPLDPDKCPVDQADRSNSRWVRYAQCERKPNPTKVRPLRDAFGGETLEMPVCGIHAGVHDKNVRKDEARATKRRVEDARKANAAAAVERLAGFGIHATENYVHGYTTGSGGYDGRVVVDPVELIRALTKEDA